MVVKFLLKKLKKSSWNVRSVFNVCIKKNCHDVKYQKSLPNNYEVFDLFIISSIVCCETECEFIEKLSKFYKRIFQVHLM